MSTTIASSPRPSAAELASAVACGALAIGGMIALPLLAEVEPDEGIAVVSPVDAGWWLVVALIVVEAIALLWVQRAPRVVLSALALVPLVHALIVPGASFSLTTLAVSFGVFWAVVGEPWRRLWAVLPLVALVAAGAQLVNDVRSEATLDVAIIVTALLQALAVVGIPLVIGVIFAARKDVQASRGRELSALRRERDALVQAAISRERMAMSRELHDIAAHHMSGIALLASAIQRQVDVDPEAAKLAAQQVRTQSTTVLDDLRRVIGLLRDEAGAARTVETLAAVHELVELRRSAGTEVRFEVFAAGHELGTGIGPLGQLVAYRMVQESLANAAVHAPGANCVVEIDDRDPKHLGVLVANDGAHAPDTGPGGGFGLVGMRERADLVGGELQYGATGDGGWQVRLTLTRDATIDDLTRETT